MKLRRFPIALLAALLGITLPSCNRQPGGSPGAAAADASGTPAKHPGSHAAEGTPEDATSRNPGEDHVVNIAGDDPEMNAAIVKARNLLPGFWAAFERREHGEDGFALKVKITDGDEAEHFWASDIERKDGQIFGTIDNDPEVVGNVQLGDRILIPEADISDWLYTRDNKMVGNYTLRVLFKQMAPEEVEALKQRLADP